MVKKKYDKAGKFISLLAIFLIAITMNAQQKSDSIAECPIKSLSDILKKKDTLLTLKKPIKNSFFILIPVIGSQPATGFLFGVTGQYTFKGKQPKDKYSTINAGVNYTTKHQLLVNAKNNLLLNTLTKLFLRLNNKYFSWLM